MLVEIKICKGAGLESAVVMNSKSGCVSTTMKVSLVGVLKRDHCFSGNVERHSMNLSLALNQVFRLGSARPVLT